MIYQQFFDRVLTRTDPEWVHHRAFGAIRAATPVLRAAPVPGRPVRALGLTFPNVLGMAAGFDKNAIGIDALGGLGFGHVEIGTVTGLPQPGNPQPRLFRLPADHAIVNRMGFNNDGAEVVARRLTIRAERTARSARRGPVLGVNIGKSKVVPDDDQAAVEADYELSARLLAPLADYLVVNVSSPNTPGLRNLQAVERLEPLLRHVRRTADDATETSGRRVPLLVKIAPDLADDDIDAVADLAGAVGLDGIIATNTTISRADLRTPSTVVESYGAGGLSGRPLTARSCEVVRRLRGRVAADMTLIGVGGITTVADAQERLDAGADLLQGYTAFVYEGPLWARRITSGVAGGSTTR